MSDDELADVLKYSSPDTLYIVNWNNLLEKLFCPFRVMVKHNIGELEKGEVVWVNGVKVTSALKTVYMVKNKAYYYDHFEILDP
jgi:hypothetical protein